MGYRQKYKCQKQLPTALGRNAARWRTFGSIDVRVRLEGEGRNERKSMERGR